MSISVIEVELKCFFIGCTNFSDFFYSGEVLRLYLSVILGFHFAP